MTPKSAICERRYAILGTGAVGGYYGARLAHAGLEVSFLLRGDYELVRDRGLVVDSKEGDFSLKEVRAYRQARDLPDAEVYVLATKSTENDGLPELLAPIARSAGAILVLQNGLGVEDEVARIVGPGRVFGGTCFLCSQKVGPGHVRHLDYGRISLGEYSADDRPAGVTDRLRAIAGDFERAGIPVQLAEDLRRARWQKLVWNIPFNGLSVILDAQTDQLMAEASTRALAEALMREVAAAARGEGRLIDEKYIDAMLRDTAKMVPYKTSMKLDFDAGRHMEVEAIVGNPVRSARRAGVPVPCMETIYHLLQYLDARGRPRAGLDRAP